MTRSCDRWLPRVAVIAALGAAFALAGCGRKSGLDAPPSAAISQPVEDQPTLGENIDPGMTGFNRPPSANRTAPAPPVPPDKRSFFLDFLIK